MDPETSHIVCGHVPVKVKDGEDPVKCGGRVFMIDGGFSRAYQPTTGIAGYTLIDNSYEFILAAHEPLKSAAAAVVEELDIHSSRRVVERVEHRTLVADTDDGADIRRRVEDTRAAAGGVSGRPDHRGRALTPRRTLVGFSGRGAAARRRPDGRVPLFAFRLDRCVSGRRGRAVGGTVDVWPPDGVRCRKDDGRSRG